VHHWLSSDEYSGMHHLVQTVSAFWSTVDVIAAALVIRYVLPELDGGAVLLVGILGLIVACSSGSLTKLPI
jgi:uncharacterized membrane protein YecN with MAPEG domain